MTDRQLECIVTIAKYQSLTKAAKELFVSQSSLSQMVAKTEQDLGSSLFNRTRTAMIPTYAGKMYIQAATEILDIQRELEDLLTNSERSKRGQLTVALSTNRSALYMPAILPNYMSQFPNVDIIVNEDDRTPPEEAVLCGKADVAIAAHPGLYPDLEYKYLCTEYLTLVFSVLWDDLILSREKGTVDLNCLRDRNFLLVKRGHDIRNLTDRACSDALFTPKILLESHSLEVCFQLAVNGLGATMVPDTMAIFHAERNRVRCYKMGEAYSRQIAIIYKKRKHYPLILSQFIEIASEAIAQFHSPTKIPR